VSRADVIALREEYRRACAREPWGEAAAAAVLLGCERLAGDDRLARHASKDGVHWDAVLADSTWSPTEHFLLTTAAGLWTGRRTEVDISRLGYLDDGFYALWQAILTAARTGRIPEARGPGR
jgi:hypothetical protein